MSKDDPVLIDLRVKMSSKEDDMLTFVSEEKNMPKSVIVRQALQEYFARQEVELSALEELHKRATEGTSRGAQRRILGKMNQMQGQLDDIRGEINEL